MTEQWCALCIAYTDHDTVHHDAVGGIAEGDRVMITKGEYADRTGLIQQHKGFEVVVRLPGRRNTETVTVPTSDVKRIG